MKRIRNVTILFALFILAIPHLAQAKPCRGSAGKDCFILRVDLAEREALLHDYGLELIRQLDDADSDLLLVAAPENIPTAHAEELVRQDARTIGVEAVRVAALAENASGSAADGTLAAVESLLASGEEEGSLADHFSTRLWSGYTGQPAMSQIRADAAHGLKPAEARGEGAVVAIIDTGVDPQHPVLAGALVPGYDFLLDEPGYGSEWRALDASSSATAESALRAVAEQSYATILEGAGSMAFVNQSYATILEQSYATILESQDLPQAFGHGTMVAGVVRLMAPAAKIMPLRVFDGDGSADLNDIVEAIRFAVRNGANVINMSFSTSESSAELLRAIRYAASQRVVLVTSTGNEGVENLTYPAAHGAVFGVASVDADNELSEFSNFGPDITLLAAPGEEIITAFPGGLYAAAWGTSFAAPFVSGTAALLHRLSPPRIERMRVTGAQAAFEDSSYQPDIHHPSDAWGSGILDSLEAFSRGLAVR